MLNILKFSITVFFVWLVYGCSGSGGSSGGDSSVIDTPTEPTTFSAKLFGIEVIRKSDNKTLPVTNLPIQSAEITVKP